MKKVLAGFSLGTMVATNLQCNCGHAVRKITNSKSERNNARTSTKDYPTDYLIDCLVKSIDLIYDSKRIFEDSDVLNERVDKATAEKVLERFLAEVAGIEDEKHKMDTKCHGTEYYEKFLLTLDKMRLNFELSLEEKLKLIELNGYSKDSSDNSRLVSLKHIEIIDKLIKALK